MLPLTAAVLFLSHQTNVREFPAFRAYSEPKPEAIQIPESGAVPGWDDKNNHLVWYVKFRKLGAVKASVLIHSDAKVDETMRLDYFDSQGIIGGAGTSFSGSGTQELPGGTVELREPGYVKFVLSSAHSLKGLQIDSLKLVGDNVFDALVNETRWRSAASVHLRWPVAPDSQVTWFYNEILPKSAPLATYYMACGWHRGYFGIQANSPTERRVIFSVWDSGTEKNSRDNVAKDLQVQLVGKGPGVFTGSFGNEGTGGHSHLVYPWKVGQVQRFLVRAQPAGDKTTYSGYYYFNDRKQWGLISSWTAPQDGKYLHGLYSFIEDFWGGEGQKQRVADYGPAWVQNGKTWTQVQDGSFTHTAKMANYREDYFFKVNGIRVTASSGGYTNDGPVEYGAKFTGVKPAKPLSADTLDFIAAVENGKER